MTKEEIIRELKSIEKHIESCGSIFGIGSISCLIAKLENDLSPVSCSGCIHIDTSKYVEPCYDCIKFSNYESK